MKDGGRVLGVAVVGAGYWGPNLIRSFTHAPGWELRWVCDLSEERLHSALGPSSTARGTSSLNTVLADPAVQAVAVATPASTHVEIVKAVLESGRHVLVEKPLATSVSEARTLVELAADKGLTLMCNHTACYSPAVSAIGELIDSGELGDIHYVESTRVNLGRIQRDVDVTWDLALHDLAVLDVLLPKTQRPVAVSALGADPVGMGKVSLAHMSLVLAGGAMAHSQVSWLAPVKMRRMSVGGSRRMLVWDELSTGHELSVYDKGVDILPVEVPNGTPQRTLRYRLGETVVPVLPERQALSGVTAELATAITMDRAPLTDGRSALRVTEILEAASRSMALGGASQQLRLQQ